MIFSLHSFCFDKISGVVQCAFMNVVDYCKMYCRYGIGELCYVCPLVLKLRLTYVCILIAREQKCCRLYMSLRIYRIIFLFLPVNASLLWLNKLSVFFLSFLLITSGVELWFGKKWIVLLLVLHQECWALYWLFSSGVGVKFAQSSSQWEATVDFWRNLANCADQ